MKKGFYSVMTAQALSSIADNALFISAVFLISDLYHGPEWMQAAMKLFFALAYVSLAAFVGAFADSYPKGVVMFITNVIKFCGCLLVFNYLLFPSWGNVTQSYMVCLAYAIVGIGAAAYSPAKYGIVTELLPPEDLVKGNSWIEGLTVLSIIIGTVLGGLLVSDTAAQWLFAHPTLNRYFHSPGQSAIVVILFIYMLAAIANLFIPNTHYVYPKQEKNPVRLILHFSRFVKTLWADKVAQISLAITTLFWGAGVILQLLVILWTQDHLKLPNPISQSSYLLGVAAIGTAVGAVLASRVPLRKALMVLPAGLLMALGSLLMNVVSPAHMWQVYLLLMVVGACSGFFVVPLNALLQHRGHVLLSAGHSIAVQNFNEQSNIVLMTGIYWVLLTFHLHVTTLITLFASFVAISMLLCIFWYRYNHKHYPEAFEEIGDTSHGRTLSS